VTEYSLVPGGITPVVIGMIPSIIPSTRQPSRATRRPENPCAWAAESHQKWRDEDGAKFSVASRNLVKQKSTETRAETKTERRQH
jgi:hypothetical protein